jgi:hypothetical protein
MKKTEGWNISNTITKQRLVYPAGSAKDKSRPTILKFLFGRAIHGRIYVNNVY